MVKMEKILFAPPAILNAFTAVQRLYPDLLTVSYDEEMRWLYQLKDGSAPNFEGKVDVAVLEAGADALTQVPVCFYAMEVTLPDTLNMLWQGFGKETVDPDGYLERPFLFFDKGTNRLDVWKWFEAQHSEFSVAKGGINQ